MDSSIAAVRLLTKSEVAKLFSVSARAISRAVVRGELHPVRLGRRIVRFREDDVAAVSRPARLTRARTEETMTAPEHLPSSVPARAEYLVPDIVMAEHLGVSRRFVLNCALGVLFVR
jgi:excisionase family DNA binding protein